MLCKVEGCAKKVVVKSKGLCDTHRKRVDRHGDINKGRPEGWGNIKARKDRENAKLRALPKREKKNRQLRKHFKITIEDYDRMFAEQKGACQICNKGEFRKDYRTGLPMALAVDHDKVSRKVRGLLCANHNTALGLLDHSEELLLSAIVYLRKYRQ